MRLPCAPVCCVRACTHCCFCRDIGNEDDESSNSADGLAHTCMLDPFSTQYGLENTHNLVVTSFSWHPAGHSLFVAYGVSNPHGYCPVPGLMCQWSLTQSSNSVSQVLALTHIASTLKKAPLNVHTLNPSRVCTHMFDGIKPPQNSGNNVSNFGSYALYIPSQYIGAYNQ